MDNENQNDSTAIEIIGQRAPSYNKNELEVLINLVEKYKGVILNRATNASSNYAKDVAWAKITKLYNNHNFKHKRSIDNLRTKWDNLKKYSRKVSKNLMDDNTSELDEVTMRIVQLLNEVENSDELESNEINIQELNDEEDIPIKYNQDEPQSADDSGNENMRKLERRSRSLNFTPYECDLLLKCVKQEKDIIFQVTNTKNKIAMKRSAWLRITENFNKQNPNKRTMRVLRTKLINMKKAHRRMNIKSNRHFRVQKRDVGIDVEFQPIKTEPLFNSKMDNSNIDDSEDSINGHNSPLHSNDESVDPLKFVLNADSGLGSTDCIHPWSDNESKEVVKLKIELLNYQLETARLKRKKLEEEMKADLAERENKALEASLRLRAARLKAVAAEMKLPASHPALTYTDKEKLAERYLKTP